MITKIAEDVLRFSFKKFSSNCYLIKNKTMIDTGSEEARKELVEDFKKIKVSFENVKNILLTHMHFDHVGNVLLFRKAKVYASEEEIKTFSPPFKVYPVEEFREKNFKIIKVPGHTAGSIAILYKKILFSGDTIFDKKGFSVGRTDLKESVPEKMKESIRKLLSLDYEILCPGH
ncbi:MAG: MBL fold metallo-hydrolase [Candidatus Pacearchaeota archaeon]|nr:MBL fold metallo-hydrolase [Candidatus Pacearchaeota archaeon]